MTSEDAATSWNLLTSLDDVALNIASNEKSEQVYDIPVSILRKSISGQGRWRPDVDLRRMLAGMCIEYISQ